MSPQQQNIIYKIREFNRFYTVNMNFLSSRYLNTSYSIAEVRTLFELYTSEDINQGYIVKKLSIDKGYLNRIINRFISNGLVIKQPSEHDKRISILSLTQKGIDETENLIELTNNNIREKIKELTDSDLKKLEGAIDIIINLLS